MTNQPTAHGSAEGIAGSLARQGHIVGRSGMEEFAEMLNEAVEGRDVRLVASHTKSGRDILR